MPSARLQEVRPPSLQSKAHNALRGLHRRGDAGEAGADAVSQGVCCICFQQMQYCRFLPAAALLPCNGTSLCTVRPEKLGQTGTLANH